MKGFLSHRWYQFAAMFFAVLLMVGVTGFMPATSSDAQAQGSPPAVGEIVLDGYDCDTETLSFHVYVENLPHVESNSGYDWPLFHSFTSHYAVGSDYSPSKFSAWNPPADQDPFTGNVDLSWYIPSTNVSGAQPGTGALTSVDLHVGVSSVGYVETVDSTDTSFSIDCSGGGEPGGGDLDQLIQEIIAILIRIIGEILAGTT